MKILLCRTDNIGDLVLTLSMVELIKQDNPEHEIWFLVRDYAAGVLAAAPSVSGWLSWDRLSSLPTVQAIQEIKAEKFDVSIQVHPCKPASRLLWQARVPKRIGTSRRLYHLLHCNSWVYLSRSGSSLHESLLNTLLLKKLFPTQVRTSLDDLPLPKLQARKNSKAESLLDPERKAIILHPGSNGHGREWSLDRWKALAARLDPKIYQVFISGSPAEAERFSAATWPATVQNIMGKLSLSEFISLIAGSYAMVAGSTGPIHMASALGIHALALQSSSPTRGARRWKPIGVKAEYLAIIPSCKGVCTQQSCPCIEAIEVKHVLSRIHGWSVTTPKPTIAM